MKVIVMPIVIETFGTMPKGLEKGMDQLKITGTAGNILRVALFKSANILGRSLSVKFSVS